MKGLLNRLFSVKRPAEEIPAPLEDGEILPPPAKKVAVAPPGPSANDAGDPGGWQAAGRGGRRKRALEEGELVGGGRFAALAGLDGDGDADADADDAAGDSSAEPGEMDRKQRRLEKKRLKKQQRQTVRVPSTNQAEIAAVFGENAVPRLEIVHDHASRLTMTNLRDLTLMILAGGARVNWANVHNKPIVSKVVMVLAHSLTREHLREHEDAAPFLTGLDGPFHVQAPGNEEGLHSTLQALLLVRRSAAPKRGNSDADDDGDKPATAHGYVVSEELRLEYGYPVREKETGKVTVRARNDAQRHAVRRTIDNLAEEGFRETQPLGATPAAHELLAVDCEMVTTEQGLELARVTVLDTAGKTIYDEFVLPERPILDYNTRYSGITAAKLEGVTTRLADVQAHLCSLVDRDQTALVGHGLENDLEALKLIHPTCVDTALVFGHKRGTAFRPALRYLTSAYLNRTIQSGDGGHDSAEDALAALDLVKLKVQRGPRFCPRGDPGIDANKETIMEVMARSKSVSAMVDRLSIVQKFTQSSPTTHAVPVDTDDEAAGKAAALATNPAIDFLFVQLHNVQTQEREAVSQGGEVDAQACRREVAAMDAHIRQIWDGCERRALMLVVTTPPEGLVTKFAQLKRTPEWTAAIQQQNREVVAKVRQCVFKAAVKG